MLRTSYNPQNLQALLESGSNALAKGQAQYFTPADLAGVLASALPGQRPHIVDFSCGSGSFLTGASLESRLLGVDIDASALPRGNAYVAADFTRFAPLLESLKWEADLFALNPPWDIFWHRERFAFLAQSSCPAVVQAFAQHDGRTRRDTMDSTILSLCCALHFAARWGEGILIGNEATLQRLILGDQAPHRALAGHIWAHLSIAGNICQPGWQGAKPGSEFRTGVIYFARASQLGCHEMTAENVADIRAQVAELTRLRLRLRRGPEVDRNIRTEDTVMLWQAAAQEWRRLNDPQARPLWNITLDPQGAIITNLSLFDQHSDRLPKGEVAKLFALNGKHPMQLVIQKSHRVALEEAVFGKTWRVAPAVQSAVRQAMMEYHLVRAPLRPLDNIQRLGWLDEQDTIRCTRDLGPFRAGSHYSISTRTVSVRRSGQKLNLAGLNEDVIWSGSELAIYLKAGNKEYLFMEGRLRCEEVSIYPDEDTDLEAGDSISGREAVNYSLQELAAHFDIPDVPDVATVNAEGYARNLQLLDQLEELANAL